MRKSYNAPDEVGIIAFMSKVIISKIVCIQLMNHVHSTGFQYETGGMLLGYRFLWIFYVIGITFPRHSEKATRATFILNGEEHTEDAEKIMERFVPHLQLIGIWHSHTTEDNSFSLQDKETNKILVEQIGRMLSIIVTQRRGSNVIRLDPYYISANSREFLCKYTIGGGKGMSNSNKEERCSNCIHWVHRKCSATGQVKNDGICTCGCFKPRS